MAKPMPAFEVVSIYTEGDYIKYAKTEYSTRSKKIIYGGYLLAGVSFLIFIMEILRGFNKSDLFLLFLVCSILFAVWNLPQHKANKLISSDPKLASRTPTVISFYDREFVVASGDSSGTLKYAEMTDLYLADDCFYLYLGKMCYILKKKDFTIGRYQEFADFLLSKNAEISVLKAQISVWLK